MVPHAKDDPEQLITDLFRVVQALAVAAQLNPPVAVPQPGVPAGAPIGEVGVLGEIIGPRRGCEGLWRIVAAGHEHAAQAHRARVGLRGGDGFAILGAALAAHAELGAGERGQDAVARAVDEEAGTHRVLGVGRHLPAGHCGNARTLHLRPLAGAVEQQLQPRLIAGFFVEQQVPHRVILVGVAPGILQAQLLQNARLAPVRQVPMPVGAADVHAHLAGGIAAQHRPLMHEEHPRPMPRGCQPRAQAGQPPTDNADVGIVRLLADAAVGWTQ